MGPIVDWVDLAGGDIIKISTRQTITLIGITRMLPFVHATCTDIPISFRLFC